MPNVCTVISTSRLFVFDNPIFPTLFHMSSSIYFKSTDFYPGCT